MDNKELVGKSAAYLVDNNSILGIGTGSTAEIFIKELGKRVKEEGLQIKAVSTSVRSADLAKSFGIEVLPVDEVDHIDLCIDGVDEFTDDCQGIKGGGGAHLEEKIVATYSDRVVWMAEERKHVDYLGAFSLAVEVIKNGHAQLFKIFEDRGYKPSLRKVDSGEPFITDNGNYVIDLHMEKIDNPQALSEELIKMVGVVEHGLFIDIADDVLIAGNDQVYFVSGAEYSRKSV
ncbi:ribose-5-phosphate isomerase RpiA [Aerococcus urinae]|uniref:ribose-5-phosphate isomerase RpiA n=1 Tax=Aerococcus urinae TaxID=1376 RepID=UPI00227B1878|nr:ribose-5-phosphate isomerase RpiA [Aerococcus urinae]MCY3045717.1 ribose-5-phosphate isomerase RpiA [Aerococcus urinae]